MLTVGGVVTQLAVEFPELTVSKVRFLETEGIVTPERTASGYRRYAEADVERLRYALRAQRDRYWPLRVVRDALDALERGLEVDDQGAVQVDSGVSRDTSAPHRPPREVRLTRAELLQLTGLPEAVATDLVGFGLLQPDHEGLFSGYDLTVAAAAAELAAVGLGGRHLRSFRSAAQREVELIESALASRGIDDDDRVTVGRRLGEVTAAMHRALIARALDDPEVP